MNLSVTEQAARINDVAGTAAMPAGDGCYLVNPLVLYYCCCYC